MVEFAIHAAADQATQARVTIDTKDGQAVWEHWLASTCRKLDAQTLRDLATRPGMRPRRRAGATFRFRPGPQTTKAGPRTFGRGRPLKVRPRQNWPKADLNRECV